jgi:hypothetical protein
MLFTNYFRVSTANGTETLTDMEILLYQLSCSQNEDAAPARPGRGRPCEDVSTIVLLDQLQAETCGGRGQQVRRVNTRV